MTYFLKALPTVAQSPLALVGYLAVVIAWALIAWRVKRNQNLFASLEKLPDSQRLEALRIEMGSIPVGRFSPDQWLKAKTRSYMFAGFMALVLVALCIVAASLQVTLRDRDITQQDHKIGAQTLQAQLNREKQNIEEQGELSRRRAKVIDTLSSELRLLVALEGGQAAIPWLLRLDKPYWNQLLLTLRFCRTRIKETQFTLEQDQGELLLSGFDTYRSIVLELGRRLEIYDEIEDMANNASHRSRDRLDALATEYDRLHEKLSQHERELQKLIPRASS